MAGPWDGPIKIPCKTEGCEKFATASTVYQACDEHTAASVLPCPAWEDRKHLYEMGGNMHGKRTKLCACGAEVKHT